MNRNIFISHSNKFIEITIYFAEFLKSRGLNPIVVELMPNGGQLWTVAEKVKHCREICDSALVIATPDEIQDGKLIPRMDVNYELGCLSDKKIIVVKEVLTNLPKSVDPVYIPFALEDPSGCLEQLDIELESIYGEGNITKVPFNVEPPCHRTQPAYIFEGINLVPEEPEKIQETVQHIFLEKSKKEQANIVNDIVRHIYDKIEDTRWVTGLILEQVLEYDPSLVPIEAIVKLSEDQSFSVRSSAAVCLFTLANIAQSRVPLDIVIKLASFEEDWYVFTPAVATLKTLAHRRLRAFDIILSMALSKDKHEAEYGTTVLLDVVSNDPQIIGDENLRKLDGSGSKLIKDAVKRIRKWQKQKRYKPDFVRYSPF